METLGDLVARSRRGDDSALAAPREGRSYDYHRFCTTAWKTGNFFRRLGVHDAATVAVADDPAPEAVFAFFGAALLGARTEFGPLRDYDHGARTARVAVAPHEAIEAYDLPPGGQRVAYGGPPDDPAIHQFERDVWSENPAFPETPVNPEAVAVVAGGDDRDDSGDGSGSETTREFSHADLLSAARAVADDWGLEPGDEVSVRAPLSEPGTVVAGVVAPLLAGAAILLPDEGTAGDYAVVGEGADPGGRTDAPEPKTLAASAVV